MNRVLKCALVGWAIGSFAVGEAWAFPGGRGGGGRRAGGGGGARNPGADGGLGNREPQREPQRDGTRDAERDPNRERDADRERERDTSRERPETRTGDNRDRTGDRERARLRNEPRTTDQGRLEGFLGIRSPEAGPRPNGDGARLSYHSPANKPFSTEWYAQHPNAFQATHPHGDAWAVATASSLSRWLAVPVVATPTVVTTESVATTSTPAPATSEEATNLAQTGGTNPSADGEWMPIGIYSLLPVNEKESTRVVQLLVNRDGVVRGNHWDLLSDEAQVVQGAVDKKTQNVAFSIGKGGKVVFQGTLADLTRDQATVTAFYPDGQSAPWKLVVSK